MESNERLMAWLFLAGGALMVAGAGLFSFLVAQGAACIVFLAGAILFGVTQMRQPRPADTITVKRLKRIMTVADLLFIAAGILMADTHYMFLRRLLATQEAYLSTVYNKWVVVLLVAAVLEIYTMHRMNSELKKSA